MGFNIEQYDDIYFSEQFKEVIRSCKERLLAKASVCVLNDKSFVYAHRNNPYTLLRGMGIDERLIWTTVFINDIKEDTDLLKLSVIYINNIGDIDQLLIHQRTTKK